VRGLLQHYAAIADLTNRVDRFAKVSNNNRETRCRRKPDDDANP